MSAIAREADANTEPGMPMLVIVLVSTEKMVMMDIAAYTKDNEAMCL
jgi:hypothetical protein